LAIVESGEGTLIGYSTQPGNVALDGKGRNSPYAAALLKHIATPGDDLSTILIKVRNDVIQATGRRQVPWEHSALTARFYFVPPQTRGEQIELEFWASVKDSTSSAVLGTYLERYPDGEFAPIARALIAHYEQQLKAELAAREEARRRQEEEKKAAEVRRLEEERRARETAIAEERKRAEEAKSVADIKRLEEQAKAEWVARTEDLRKALEEARLAREAAKTAEKHRLAAVKTAEEATKVAEQIIAAKRAVEKAGDPAKLAALPKLEPVLVYALQRELQRIGCYRGEIDGVWGPASRSALANFNRHAKMTLSTNLPEATSLSVLQKVLARTCPEADEQRSPNATTRSRPVGGRDGVGGVSFKYWPIGAVPTHQSVTTTTAEGWTLTCVGGSTTHRLPRRCHWQ
jgi:hypothetical protein